MKNLRLAKSAITDNVFAGYVNKDGATWNRKKDVTNDFLKAVIDRWDGFEEDIITPTGKKYTVSVRSAGKV